MERLARSLNLQEISSALDLPAENDIGTVKDMMAHWGAEQLAGARCNEGWLLARCNKRQHWSGLSVA